MWRRVREAARRGRKLASSALGVLGRAAKKVGSWVGFGVINAGILLARGCKFLARGITWSWMTIVEIAALTDAPFTWVIFNVVFFIVRGIETIVNKIRGTEYSAMHNIFPAFSLQNAWGFDMVALYPLVVLVGWILSPLTGQVWFRKTMAEYKMRAIDLGDWAYRGRFEADLNPIVREDKDVWAESTGWPAPDSETYPVNAQGRPTARNSAWFQSYGYVEVFPDPNSPRDSFQYLWDRVKAVVGTTEGFFIHGTMDDRYWAILPEGVIATPPEPENDPRHAKPSERMDEPVSPAEESEYADWLRPDAEVPDYNNIEDKKLRSWLYGRQIVLTAIVEIKGFLDDVELQNKQRALVFNDTKNPGSGFLSQHARKGFDEMLDAMLKAAHPV